MKSFIETRSSSGRVYLDTISNRERFGDRFYLGRSRNYQAVNVKTDQTASGRHNLYLTNA